MAEKEYRALTGINFMHKDTGKSLRVEKGEKIVGLNEIAVRNELQAGNIEACADSDPKKSHEVLRKVGE